MFWTWFKKSTPTIRPLLDLGSLDGCWDEEHGFSFPRWMRLVERGQEHPPEALYWTLTHAWLQRLAAEAGPQFRQDESQHFRLLSPFSERKARGQLRVLEDLRLRLMRTLQPHSRVGFGPHVVLIFRDVDQYWRYCSHFHPEGESGISSGMCIYAGGYVHVAGYEMASIDTLHSMLAHEMVHVLMTPYDLPVWVEEGLAQLLGEPARPLPLNEMRACWSRHGLRTFWNGQAFRTADETQSNAYELARALVGMMIEHRHLAAFLRHARKRDAGAASLREHLGGELCDLAASLLGPGSWAPDLR